MGIFSGNWYGLFVIPTPIMRRVGSANVSLLAVR